MDVAQLVCVAGFGMFEFFALEGEAVLHAGGDVGETREFREVGVEFLHGCDYAKTGGGDGCVGVCRAV